MEFTITSTAFEEGGEIPRLYTCEGKDISPPLQFFDAPDGTESLALIVEDPDAPDPKAPRLTWVHWVLYNIPPDTAELGEGAGTEAMGEGVKEGRNNWGRTGYGGPCPPIGRHRYFHRIYALDVSLPDLGQPTAAALREAMAGHVLAEATLMGVYRKQS